MFCLINCLLCNRILYQRQENISFYVKHFQYLVIVQGKTRVKTEHTSDLCYGTRSNIIIINTVNMTVVIQYDFINYYSVNIYRNPTAYPADEKTDGQTNFNLQVLHPLS